MDIDRKDIVKLIILGLVAEVGTEIMEGKCEYNTYKNVSKGDRVIIFDVDLDKNVTYAIHC